MKIKVKVNKADLKKVGSVQNIIAQHSCARIFQDKKKKSAKYACRKQKGNIF